MSVDQDRANAFIQRLIKALPAKPYMKKPSRQEQVRQAALKQKRGYHTNYQVPVNPAWAGTNDVPNRADRLSALADNENARKYNVGLRSRDVDQYPIDTGHLPFVSPRVPHARGMGGVEAGVEYDQIRSNLGHLKPRVLYPARQDRTAGNEWIRAIHGLPPKPKKIIGARYRTTYPS